VVFPPANESLRRTGLPLSLLAKSSFYLPAFEISRSCRTASALLTKTVFNSLGIVFQAASSVTESPFFGCASAIKSPLMQAAAPVLE